MTTKTKTTTAKLNVQHDYVTLRVTFPNGERINLTSNRRGYTASGSVADLRGGLDAFDAYMSKRKAPGVTIGVLMEDARKLAEAAAAPADLFAALKA